MAKIMLVEDDNNLKEIYGERLQAEGYEIVTAGDGEEGLSTAIKERPDLIISDVMMPKISGFDMLDILRQTPETMNTKVIMMTALSQAEDKDRAEKLGADKYLVKSQVTLEDLARAVHDLLNDSPADTESETEVSTPVVTSNVPVAEPPVENSEDSTSIPTSSTNETETNKGTEMQEDNTTQNDNTSMTQPVDPVAASPMPTNPVMPEAMTEAQEKNEFEANAKAFEDSINPSAPMSEEPVMTAPTMEAPVQMPNEEQAMPAEEFTTPAPDSMPSAPMSEEPVMTAPTMEAPVQMPNEEQAMPADTTEVSKEEDPEHPSTV
jgi:DNA-binding response OmpR family regulator